MSEEQNQPGIVGEIVEDLHTLEQKAEHLLHPAAQDVALSEKEAGGPTRNPTSVSCQDPVHALGTLSDAADSGDDPNAAASPAVDSSASDTQSSARPVSQDVAMQAASVSVSVANSIGKLRAFLWQFKTSSVAHLHAELDKLESILK
ncbi:hypothetical protein [Burkholderia thailandensis]|uniref:hypothetical protein n=1 Tax=Burkholderia thailandensis TaxID=57975 RepID=UPI00107E7B03|nr:hypothetical protein [Burkholderia thailandensis]TGB34387.1 hypothetical protein C6946_07100 [Burkholderia thailandensis]